MAKKFPAVLYVKFEDGGTGPDYLMSADSLIDLTEMGQRCKVGIYKLTGTTMVEGVVSTGQSRLKTSR